MFGYQPSWTPRICLSLFAYLVAPLRAVSHRVPALLSCYQPRENRQRSSFYPPFIVCTRRGGRVERVRLRDTQREEASLFRGRSDTLFHPRPQSCRTAATCHTIVSKFPAHWLITLSLFLFVSISVSVPLWRVLNLPLNQLPITVDNDSPLSSCILGVEQFWASRFLFAPWFFIFLFCSIFGWFQRKVT